MALIVDLSDTSIGAELAGCYLRVVRVEGTKEYLRVFVEAHVSEAARRAERQYVLSTQHGINPDALTGPLFPALYAHLKTLPEYAGATDC